MSIPPFEELSNLDRLVHEPARLSILTALEACHAADFTFLQSLTGLSAGNLSRHLSKLQQGGLVRIEKSFKGKVPQTYVQLTAEGRAGIQGHWRRLETLRKAAGKWRKPARAARNENPDGPADQ
jgi:DNA-binding transcriptional ArsR family regulator